MGRTKKRHAKNVGDSRGETKHYGGCCNARTATIIINIFNACSDGLFLIVMLAINFLDGEMKDALKNFDNDFSKHTGLVVFVMIIRSIVGAVGTWGAINYNVWAVGVALVGHVVELVLALTKLEFGGMVLAAFFALPHIFFVGEIQRRSTIENHAHEE